MSDNYQVGDLTFTDALKPIAFNPIKHHRRFVCSYINKLRECQNIGLLKNTCDSIGGTLLDFYIGELSVSQIVQGINTRLLAQGVNNLHDYKEWLGWPTVAFKCIEIVDGSRWVLRLGTNMEYYVHIHPGRYSPFTIRCRPNTLKVAIAILYLAGEDTQNIDIQLVNYARQLVGLSSLGELSTNSAIMKLVSTLNVNCG